jgi:hypothetical protein
MHQSSQVVRVSRVSCQLSTINTVIFNSSFNF